jgi:hypothetical protein
VGDDLFGVLRQRRRKHQKGPPDAGIEQRDGLRRVRDAQRIVAQTDQLTRHDAGAVPVRIRLDGRPQRPRTRQLLPQAHIVAQTAEVDDRRREVTPPRAHSVSPRRRRPCRTGCLKITTSHPMRLCS